MPSAAYLRRQADICLRLAAIASDEAASSRLLAIHQDYTAKADAMEAGGEAPQDAMTPPGASTRRKTRLRRGLVSEQPNAIWCGLD